MRNNNTHYKPYYNYCFDDADDDADDKHHPHVYIHNIWDNVADVVGHHLTVDERYDIADEQRK